MSFIVPRSLVWRRLSLTISWRISLARVGIAARRQVAMDVSFSTMKELHDVSSS